MQIKETTSHLIGGEKVPSTGDEGIAVANPSNGDGIGFIPAGTKEDADAAVAAAREALPQWSRMPAAERAGLVKEAARKMRGYAKEISELVTLEMGKTIDDALGGVEAGIGTLEQYAELGPLHRGRALNGGWDAADMMVFEPRGVVGLLVPWNDPVAIALSQVGAALAVGNAVVLKPSERTPLATQRAVEVLRAAGLPVELLLGDERAGRPLAAHPGVDCVMHTGAVETGREIAQVCARDLRKALLELGGKDPLVVDAGVDPVWAAEQTAQGAFANAGQLCTSVERIHAHRDVAEAYVDALVARAQSTELGPLIDERQREVVHRHVQDAVARGAQVRCGGELPEGAGSFYPPTVLTGCTPDMLVFTEETFGPLAAVQVVDSFEDALEAANATEFGLQATVLTPSHANAQRAWRELRAGTVKVNAVWGGAPGGACHPRGCSGSGFGYGPELLDELTQVKAVHLEPAPGATA